MKELFEKYLKADKYFAGDFNLKKFLKINKSLDDFLSLKR